MPEQDSVTVHGLVRHMHHAEDAEIEIAFRLEGGAILWAILVFILYTYIQVKCENNPLRLLSFS